jgi:osmoprotectant transport system substrate-binding protein
MRAFPHRLRAWLTSFAVAVCALGLVACGGRSSTTTVTTTVAAKTTPLPGTGRPTIAIGDKNFTEQFILGELYYLALKAQGYTVTLTRNIGPTEVTMRALTAGTLSMYPEYLSTWNTTIAGDRRDFHSLHSAYRVGLRWAEAHGFEILHPTPFSDTAALAVSFNYAVAHNLVSIGDLRKLDRALVMGGPLQFQTEPTGLPAITKAYEVAPASFKSLDIGAQYQALDQGTVEVADVNTTDGQLITHNYTLLSDPLKVFGYGNVVPVVPLKVIQAEGPQFVETVNAVSGLLTLGVIRQLNAAVDVDNEDPTTVATQFLQEHGLLPASASSSGTSAG